MALSKLNVRTGLLDADLFGPSVPRMMNLQSPPDGLPTADRQLIPLANYGVKCMSMGFLVPATAPIVWRGLMVMKALQQLLYQVRWAPLDVLVIDMPPGTGDTQLTITQLLPIDGAVIVTTPQDVAVADARKGVEMFRKVDVPILGIVNNMSHFQCPHCHRPSNVYQAGPDRSLDRLRTELNVPLMGEIPIEPLVASEADSGRPIVVSHPDSISSQIFVRIANQVAAHLIR